MNRRDKHGLVLTEYYYPEEAGATGTLMTETAEDMAPGWLVVPTLSSMMLTHKTYKPNSAGVSRGSFGLGVAWRRTPNVLLWRQMIHG